VVIFIRERNLRKGKMADFILKNIFFGDTEVDSTTLEPIRTFLDAPLRAPDGEPHPDGDRSIVVKNIIVPYFAMEMYHDAPDMDTRKKLLPLIKEQQELSGVSYEGYKNKAYESWFKTSTKEGSEGMDAYKGDHSFNYPQYYLDKVIADPEFEQDRMLNSFDLPDEYRTKAPVEDKKIRDINPIVSPTDFLRI